MRVLHGQSLHSVLDLVISACWGHAGFQCAVYQHVAIFEAVVLFPWFMWRFLNIHLCITKLLAKFIQYHCSQVILSLHSKWKSDVYLLTQKLTASQWLALSANGKIQCADEGHLHISTEKGISRTSFVLYRKLGSNNFRTYLLRHSTISVPHSTLWESAIKSRYILKYFAHT